MKSSRVIGLSSVSWSISFSPLQSPCVTFLLMNVTFETEPVSSEFCQRRVFRESVIECVCSCVDDLYINVKRILIFNAEITVVDGGSV